MRKFFEKDEHGDSLFDIAVFVLTFVGMLLALAFMPGW